ncbi:MAG: UbiA family prenyltransferase [Planctomycetes bacterium]|nr:UbiA family prenyltransferase [Planctomycetota bacterium]
MNRVAWGRLLRLSLLPTALADIAAGAVWAQGGFDFAKRELWLLMAASLCLYHGGMVLNDWADHDEDATRRPERPLPSGAIDKRAAATVAFGLLLLGPILAYQVDPRCGLVMACVAVCAAAYDLFGRGPWLGPLLLGACRAGNLGAGVALGVLHGTSYAGTRMPWQPTLAVLPLAYGAYVFCVSRVGRLEDSDEPLGRRPATWIRFGLLVMALIPVLPIPIEDTGTFPSDIFLDETWVRHWPMAIGQAKTLAVGLIVFAAIGPLKLAFGTRDWTRPLAMAATGMLLRRLLVFTAAASIARGSLDGLIVGGAILCGYPIAFALRRVFPPS